MRRRIRGTPACRSLLIQTREDDERRDESARSMAIIVIACRRLLIQRLNGGRWRQTQARGVPLPPRVSAAGRGQGWGALCSPQTKKEPLLDPRIVNACRSLLIRQMEQSSVVQIGRAHV